MTDKQEFTDKDKIIQEIVSACPDGTIVDYLPDKPDGREAFRITVPETCKLSETEFMFFGYGLSAQFYEYDLFFFRLMKVEHPRAHACCTSFVFPKDNHD